MLRISEGITRAELAKAVNVHPSTIAKYETGARLPRLDVLFRMAEFYDIYKTIFLKFILS